MELDKIKQNVLSKDTEVSAQTEEAIRHSTFYVGLKELMLSAAGCVKITLSNHREFSPGNYKEAGVVRSGGLGEDHSKVPLIAFVKDLQQI